jgi:hypothetical protein
MWLKTQSLIDKPETLAPHVSSLKQIGQQSMWTRTAVCSACSPHPQQSHLFCSAQMIGSPLLLPNIFPPAHTLSTSSCAYYTYFFNCLTDITLF